MCRLCTVSWSVFLTVTINPKSDVISAISFQVCNHRTTHLWGPPSICIFRWHFGTLVNEPSSTTHISSSSWRNSPSKPLRIPSPFMFIVIKHLSRHHSCRFTVTDACWCFWCWDTGWVALMERQASKSLETWTLNQHIQLISITKNTISHPRRPNPQEGQCQ